MSVPFAVFGPGILIATRTDTSPGIAVNVGFVQEFSIDFTGTTKQLYGQYQFPLVAARGTIKATGKFKCGVNSGLAANNLFYGASFSTAAANLIAWTIDSTYTVSSGSTTALQVGSSLTFDADLGVKNVASGLPFQRVSTGSESSGKYSITTGSPGLYNFVSADTSVTGGLNLKITYTAQNAPAGSQSLLYTNQLIGFTPTFQLDYYTNLNQPSAKPFIIRVYSAILDKEVMNFKLEDFMNPEFDFSLFANASNQVFNKVYPEIS